jgi:cell division protein FtsB
LKNDPEAIKEVARSRYFMKTDNEDIFIVEEDDE